MVTVERDALHELYMGTGTGRSQPQAIVPKYFGSESRRYALSSALPYNQCYLKIMCMLITDVFF